MYITDLSHLLDDKGAIAPQVGAPRKLADFLTAVVAFASSPDRLEYPSGPLCFHCTTRDPRIVAAAIIEDDTIAWVCPACGSEGRISNWQGSFWDLRRRPARGRPSDTPRLRVVEVPAVAAETVGSKRASRPRAKLPGPKPLLPNATSGSTRYAWQFAPRFRRNAFGWRSDLPIQRLKEAVSEIRKVARTDRNGAAEGAVVLFEKLVPAIENVDSSSGAMGSAVHWVIDKLVPVIAEAPWTTIERQRWLERLWQAVDEDGYSYIETLAEHWGSLCAGRELAERWIATFKPAVERKWDAESRNPREYLGYFKGTPACLSCMLAAGQCDALLALLERNPRQWWHDRRWGVDALVALGRPAEALRYAEDSRALNDPVEPIAQACEQILLSCGRADEAYRHYAIDSNRAGTHLATFRAIAAKYPNIPRAEILRDLAASTPGAEGKWFAAAKDAGHYDLAIELATTSPTDPRTLNRAARDFAEAQPGFALAAALTSLHWIALGYGYELTGLDVSNAYEAAMRAAAAAGIDEAAARARVRAALPTEGPGLGFIRSILGPRLDG